MADFSVTASQVQPPLTAASTWLHGIAGADITAGMAVYKDSTDSDKLKPAGASAQASSVVVGIAICTSYDDQPVTYLPSGSLVLGAAAALTVGAPVFLSATGSGKMTQVSGDLTGGNYLVYIGAASTSSQISMNIHNSGTIRA